MLSALRHNPLLSIAARHARQGAAAVELAVVAPFLGFLFLVSVDFARIYRCTQTLQSCAEAGAIYASGTATTTSAIGPTLAAQQAACAEGISLDPPLTPGNVTVTLSNTTATVTVQYSFPMLTGVFDSTGSVFLQRSVTMNLAPVGGR